MVPVADRGNAYGFFYIGPLVGPVIGPTLGGQYLVVKSDVRQLVLNLFYTQRVLVPISWMAIYLLLFRSYLSVSKFYSI